MINESENKTTNGADYINALSHNSALGILHTLCRDSDLSDRIMKMVKMSLSNIDADKIADNVFNSLNSIDVEDLWSNSGKTRYGYSEPTEVAYEMLDGEVSVFIREMKQYRDLGMYKEEKEYCKGILAGVLRYGNEGKNEFRDWTADDSYTIADNIIYEWKDHHSADDSADLQAFYDSFFCGEDDEQN